MIGLDRTDSVKLRQDGCLARRNEGLQKELKATQEWTEANLREMKVEVTANNE
jgi:hypothetical protein